MRRPAHLGQALALAPCRPFDVQELLTRCLHDDPRARPTARELERGLAKL